MGTLAIDESSWNYGGSHLNLDSSMPTDSSPVVPRRLASRMLGVPRLVIQARLRCRCCSAIRDRKRRRKPPKPLGKRR